MTEKDWDKVAEDMKGKTFDPETGRVIQKRKPPKPTKPPKPPKPPNPAKLKKKKKKDS